MSFLKSLFGREDRFFGLLEASAEQGRVSVRELQALLQSAPTAISLEKVIASRQRELEIDEEIAELLCQGRSAPFDREDIDRLARALGRIPRDIKRFATRYEICVKWVQGVSFDTQLGMLEEAVGSVCAMVSELRSPKLATTKAHHDALHQVEREADKLLIATVMELYRKRPGPVKALMLRELYELLETVIDRCRTAGNIILRLVLKTT